MTMTTTTRRGDTYHGDAVADAAAPRIVSVSPVGRHATKDAPSCMPSSSDDSSSVPGCFAVTKMRVEFCTRATHERGHGRCQGGTMPYMTATAVSVVTFVSQLNSGAAVSASGGLSVIL
jgi:hypothetical protein